MELNSIIKLKKIVSVADLSGEKAMIDFETGKYYLVKGTGNDIWDMIQEEISVNEIVDKLLEEYDVTREKCTESVLNFLENLKSKGFID